MRAAAWFLMLAGLGEAVPGLIHYFLPDGGAGTIAGIRLGANAPLVIALFAWTGAVQIPFGLLLLAIGWRYRQLVPHGLAAVMAERALMAWDGWLGKASRLGHHPPEHYGSPVMAGLCLIFLIVALRSGDPYGNRTRVSAVRGPRPDR